MTSIEQLNELYVKAEKESIARGRFDSRILNKSLESTKKLEESILEYWGNVLDTYSVKDQTTPEDYSRLERDINFTEKICKGLEVEIISDASTAIQNLYKVVLDAGNKAGEQDHNIYGNLVYLASKLTRITGEKPSYETIQAMYGKIFNKLEQTISNEKYEVAKTLTEAMKSINTHYETKYVVDAARMKEVIEKTKITPELIHLNNLTYEKSSSIQDTMDHICRMRNIRTNLESATGTKYEVSEYQQDAEEKVDDIYKEKIGKFYDQFGQ